MILVDSALSTAPADEELIITNEDEIICDEPVQETEVHIAEEVQPEPAAEEKVSCVTPAKNSGNGVVGMGVPERRKAVPGGHYKHFKGGNYVLLNIAKDHETCDKIAVYMSLDGKPDVWARPLDMFLEDVNDHGNIKPRFEYIPE